MAFVVKDRVKDTTTTTGTGNITLSNSAPTGFQTFNSAIGTGNTTYYCIAGQGTSEWETGLATLSGTPATTLARTTVFESSNAGSLVNFSAGTKDVFVTYPASKASTYDSVTTYDAVGSYVWAGSDAGTAFSAGSTYSGANLKVAGMLESKSLDNLSFGATLSGTWRAMGHSASADKTATLFVRTV